MSDSKIKRSRRFKGLDMGTVVFEGRVSLKNLTSKDLEYFYLWASDPEVAKTMTWEAYT